jgi:hypothetical protein
MSIGPSNDRIIFSSRAFRIIERESGDCELISNSSSVLGPPEAIVGSLFDDANFTVLGIKSLVRNLTYWMHDHLESFCQ